MFSFIHIFFSKRDYVNFAILLLIMLGGSFMELITLGAFPLFISLFTAPDASSPIKQHLLSYLEAMHLPMAQNLIFWGGIILALLFTLRTFYMIISYALQERLLQNRKIALTSRLFQAYMNAPYVYHIQHNPSECISNVTGECATVISCCLDSFLNIIRNGVILITVVLLLLSYDPWICLCVFSSLGITAGLFMFLTKHRLQQLGHIRYLAHLKVQKYTTEGLSAFKEAQILNCKECFEHRLHQAVESQYNHEKVQKLLTRSIWPFMELITCSIILGTLVVLSYLSFTSDNIAQVIALVAISLARLKGIISEIMIYSSQFKSNQKAAQILSKELNILEAFPHDVQEVPHLELTDSVALTDVLFTFPNATKPTLHNLSLTIPCGTTLGIVGPTGSGKTTVANLLAGLFRPQQGMLSVNQMPMDTSARLRAWQNLIGIVPQDTFLTDDTIKANIAFGILPEAVDETMLQKAVQAAQLSDFIHTLPHGLDTLIGDRGIRLSGGQRQRIAIARALYRNPSFIIFDEATSALDVNTEKAVVEALEHLHGKHTIVVIAHRLSTVRKCDTIAFVKNGQIIGQGTYQQLRETLPEFAAMTNA